MFALFAATWVTTHVPAHAAPPFRRLDDPRPRFYELGKLHLPPATTPLPKVATTRGRRARPLPPDTVPPPRPRATIREVPRPALPPIRTETPTDESSTFGVSLRMPFANKLLRFVGSLQTLVPVESDKEVLDAKLSRAPPAQAHGRGGLRRRDARGRLPRRGRCMGHGSSKAMGFGVFCILSYQPKTRDDAHAPRWSCKTSPWTRSGSRARVVATSHHDGGADVT
jgi:hypothetical protein